MKTLTSDTLTTPISTTAKTTTVTRSRHSHDATTKPLVDPKTAWNDGRPGGQVVTTLKPVTSSRSIASKTTKASTVEGVTTRLTKGTTENLGGQSFTNGEMFCFFRYLF